MVIVNRNRQTGIVAKHGHKFKHLVLMKSKGIAVFRVTEQHLRDNWTELPGHDTADVAKRLLEAGKKFGITKEAERELTDIINKAASRPTPESGEN